MPDVFHFLLINKYTMLFNYFQMKNTRIFFLLLVFSILALNQCTNREEAINCFPVRTINAQLNLNLPAYFPLQNVGGWIYVQGQESGSRGLIVVRTTTGFKVYDRNAPHLCPESATTLIVEDGIKITCPKDGAEWLLLTGQPTKIANVAPVTYLYSYDQNTQTLIIYN